MIEKFEKLKSLLKNWYECNTNDKCEEIEHDIYEVIGAICECVETDSDFVDPVSDADRHDSEYRKAVAAHAWNMAQRGELSEYSYALEVLSHYWRDTANICGITPKLDFYELANGLLDG